MGPGPGGSRETPAPQRRPKPVRQAVTMPQSSPRRESQRRCTRGFLPAPNATPGDQRRPYVKRHHQIKGRKAELSREHNLPPTSHTTRLTISRDLLQGSAQCPACLSKGANAGAHFLLGCRSLSFCPC